MSGDHTGLPKSTVLVSAVAIAFAGLATFMILKWSDSRAASAELRTQIAEVEAEAEGIRGDVDSVEQQLGSLAERTSILVRGKLSVCNFSSEVVTVESAAATWLGDDGRYRTFNSTEHGKDLWRVPPGEQTVLELPRAAWDGSVTYYALWLRVAGQEYPFAGTWPPEEGDDCVLWR